MSTDKAKKSTERPITIDVLEAIFDKKLRPLTTKLEGLIEAVEVMNNKYEDLVSKVNALEEKASIVEDIEKSQSFISSQFDQFKNVNDNILKENVELGRKSSLLVEEVNQNASQIRKTKMDLNDLEQYGRRSMLEISGIPRINDEDTRSLSMVLCNQIDNTIEEADIEIAHRLSNKDTANIIIKFKDTRSRDRIYAKRSIALRNKTTHDFGLATTRAASRIFINESLTRRNKELFKLAREFKISKGYKFLWTKNGTIHLRKTEDSPITRVKHESDIPRDV